MAQPLLFSGRTLLDAGTGVGLPGLPLSLSVDSRNDRLNRVNFHRLPPVQLVTRAALDWSDLSNALPDSTAPIVRWGGPKVPPPPKRSDWIRRAVRVTWNAVHQEFYWWGPEKMFHVKQNHWDPPSPPEWTIENQLITKDF